MAYHPKVGVYYVDHLRKKNQIEDPRIEWRNLQINMLNDYLKKAAGGEHKAASLALSQRDLVQVCGRDTNVQPQVPGSSSNRNPLLSNRTSLEQSLSDAKLRVAQLKRELDANYNLLTIIDKYYKKKDGRTGVEV